MRHHQPPFLCLFHNWICIGGLTLVAAFFSRLPVSLSGCLSVPVILLHLCAFAGLLWSRFLLQKLVQVTDFDGALVIVILSLFVLQVQFPFFSPGASSRFSMFLMQFSHLLIWKHHKKLCLMLSMLFNCQLMWVSFGVWCWAWLPGPPG